MTTPAIDWLAVAPVIALAGAAVAIVLLRALVRRADWVYVASLGIAFGGLATAGGFLVAQWSRVGADGDGPYVALSDMIVIDGFAIFLGAVVLIATALVLLLSAEYLPRRGFESQAEYLALVLFSACGMIMMTTANDLIVVFMALETLSIPLYILSAFDRRQRRSLEAGMKYFILGAFSSAVFLYGVALIYGATGTTSLTGIADFLAQTTVLSQGTLLAGMMLLIVGLGFKVAAVPFHWWTPDVYEGAPTPVTAFMSSATKAAAFAAFMRIMLSGFDIYRVDWRPVIWVLAILTLVIGAVGALLQTDVKRMLAYSSINHAGYVLIGLEAANRQGLKSALFYLMVYAFMAIGGFAVVLVVSRRDGAHSIDDYRNLATRRPVIAAVFAFLLLAQAGIPPTGGFMAKLGVFSAAADAQSYVLLIVGVVTGVISAFYYLRVLLAMYAGEGSEVEADAMTAAPEVAGGIRVDLGTGVVLAITVGVVLVVGILPSLLLHFARNATLAF